MYDLINSGKIDPRDEVCIAHLFLSIIPSPMFNVAIKYAMYVLGNGNQIGSDPSSNSRQTPKEKRNPRILLLGYLLWIWLNSHWDKVLLQACESHPEV